MKLSDLIRQERFPSTSLEAMLNVVVTNNWLMGELSTAMAPYGITPAQYNVLRILRGSHPNRLTCSAVGERLLDRTPDVTRLLNRLDRAGLIVRERSDTDRRVVHVGISSRGLGLLSEMQDRIDGLVEQLTRHLSPDELRQLIGLLEVLRTDQTA